MGFGPPSHAVKDIIFVLHVNKTLANFTFTGWFPPKFSLDTMGEGSKHFAGWSLKELSQISTGASFCMPCWPAKWASTSYEWDYNPFKWPYKWVTKVMILLVRIITPFTTGRGRLCRKSSIIRIGIISPSGHIWPIRNIP